MDKKLKKILKKYQQEHSTNLVSKLSTKYVCFDTSDTGTGKTYSAIATAKLLGMKIFVVCPKTIVSFWKSVATNIFGVELVGLSNYSLLIKCKYYDDKGKPKICPYIEQNLDKSSYNWKLPDNTMIIFDEVHKCCNPYACNGQLLLSLKNVYSAKTPLLLLSATICESPSKFRLYSVLLKWFDSYNSVDRWLEPTYNPVSASKIIAERLTIQGTACGVKISDLGDEFQKNQVTSDYYDLKKSATDQIDKLHEEIRKSIMALNVNADTDKKIGFVIGMRERQKIELLKVPIFVELVEEYMENNFSVVIFVNFTETLEMLAKELKTKCVVYGEQTLQQRLKNIEDFVEDKQRIIICNVHTGGDSISLNDKYGRFRRVALISPTWSSIKLIQACGRISRTDSKTPSLNKIVYANTKHEKIMCNKIKSKCSIYTAIKDSDLMYDFE
jgi:superfamily II DNA or RNA helicase